MRERFDRSAMSARKVLLIYAQLLDEINSQGTSEHSRLLRSVADYIISSIMLEDRYVYGLIGLNWPSWRNE